MTTPDAPDASVRLSVVLFVKNAADTIERALSSVLGHGTADVELLVLDGGSTDGTLEVIRRHESRIAYWRSHSDGGPEYAIREGVDRATGEVICLLPADDWFEPGALEEVGRAFAADPGLGVLSCGARVVHYEQDGKLIVDAEFIDPGELEFTIHNLVHRVLSGGRFVRRRLCAQVGGFGTDYKMANDLEFLIRICLARPKTKVLPRVAYTYRQHPGSRTMGGQPDMVMAMMQDNIRVAAHYQADSSLLQGERKELRGFHGRCCARLAWMLMMRGRFPQAIAVLAEAVRENPMWPIQVVYWFSRHLMKPRLHA